MFRLATVSLDGGIAFIFATCVSSSMTETVADAAASISSSAMVWGCVRTELTGPPPYVMLAVIAGLKKQPSQSEMFASRVWQVKRSRAAAQCYMPCRVFSSCFCLTFVCLVVSISPCLSFPECQRLFLNVFVCLASFSRTL